MADREISVRVRVNAETGELKVLGSSFNAAGEEIKKAEKSAKEASDGFRELKSAIGGLLTAGALAEFFKSSIAAAEEQSEGMRRLKFNVEGAGQSWDKHKEQIESWVRSIQAATVYSDSEAIRTLEELTRATGNVTQAQKASEIAMGVAHQTGMSLGEATSLLTELINGNERGVQRLGREFSGLVGPVSSAQDGLDKLSAKYSDAAKSGDGLSDKTAKLRNAFGNFKQEVGDALSGPLAGLFSWLTKVVGYFDQFGTVVAAQAAKLATFMSALGESMNRALHLDFDGAKQAWSDYATKVTAIESELETSFISAEQRKTESHKVQTDARVTQNAFALKRIADQEEQALEQLRKEAEAARSQLEEQDLKLRRENQKKAEEIIADSEAKIASIGADTFPKKVAALQAEYTARRQKINLEIKDEAAAAKAITQINKEEAVAAANLAKLEAKEKREQAFQTVESLAQAAGILNSMNEKSSAAEVNRAKLILALEKAIAIARVWSDATVPIPLKAAATALVVAQFAQQSKSIDAASRAYSRDQSAISITTPGPDDTDITKTFPAGGGTSTGGGGGFAPSGGGGGGGGNVIHLGGIVINVNGGTGSPEDIRQLMLRMAEETRRNVNEAVQLALTMDAAAARNPLRAV